MDKRKVEQALRAADKGEAYHWPTIAEILAAEVRRLRGTGEHQKWCITHASCNCQPLNSISKE